MRILAFLLAASAACAAGGAAGKWSGVIIVEDPNGGGPIRTAVELELAERSGAVDGRIGRKGDRERVAIRNGSVRGATVTFEASSVETTSPMRFTLKLDRDKLEGDMRGSVDSGQIAGKVQFSRDKE